MSVQTIKLRNPLLVNGVDRKELTYDIEALTIDHITKAEAYKQRKGSISSTHAIFDYSLQYAIGMQAIMAVNSDISEEDLSRIKGFDVNKIAKVGIDFFKGSEEVSEGNTSEKPQEDTQDTTTAQ